MNQGMVNFPLWQNYVEQVCGFVLPEVQHNWLAHAINVTAKAHDVVVDELYQALIDEYHTKGISELNQSLLDNLLIAESRFFRHEPSMMFIGEQYKNAIHAKNRAIREGKADTSSDFLVWSVGCSTGQEVYSVAMTLGMISGQTANTLPFLVHGSDLSVRSLDIAKKGEYFDRQIRDIPERYRLHLASSLDEYHQIIWQIDPKIKENTRFFWHNMFTKEVVDLPKQQVIICQNVLIYFRKFDQRDILAYFVKNLAVGGWLILAPNEAIFWQHPSMKRVDNEQINAWQKISE